MLIEINVVDSIKNSLDLELQTELILKGPRMLLLRSLYLVTPVDAIKSNVQWLQGFHSSRVGQLGSASKTICGPYILSLPEIYCKYLIVCHHLKGNP